MFTRSIPPPCLTYASDARHLDRDLLANDSPIVFRMGCRSERSLPPVLDPVGNRVGVEAYVVSDLDELNPAFEDESAYVSFANRKHPRHCLDVDESGPPVPCPWFVRAVLFVGVTDEEASRASRHPRIERSVGRGPQG